MSTQVQNLRVLADFASEAVYLDLLPPEKVIAWADSMIEESEVPPAWLIEVSLADPADFLALQSALRQVPGESDREQSLALLNGLVFREWQSGNLAVDEIRYIGWELYRSECEHHYFTKWGVVVEEAGAIRKDELDAESEMREIINCELAVFEKELARLPTWV